MGSGREDWGRWVEVNEGGVLRQRAGHTGRLKQLLLLLIGLHLRLSLGCCSFVCIDKSRDLADRTLCLLSIQKGGGREGGA